MKLLSSKKKRRPGFTNGRQVDSVNARVVWRRENLDTHYSKHPGGQDRDCWADIVGRPGEQATKDEYEQASYDAVEAAEVHYTCVDIGRGDDEPKQHFLDERFVQSVTPVESRDDKLEVITCFHRHFQGSKNHVSVAAQPSLAARIRRLADDLDKRAAAGVLEKLVFKKPRNP